MGMLAGLSFAPVAREWLPLVVGLILVLLANRSVAWRYSTTPRVQRRLFGWLGLPFLLLAGLKMVSNRSTIDTSLGIAVLGTVYVFVCAVIEIYRRPGQARPEVFHMGMMTVMMVGGISSGNLLYPFCLLGYFGLAVALLRYPFGGWWGRPGPSRSRAPRWGIALAFLLALPLVLAARALLPNAGRMLARLYTQGLITNPLGEARLFAATSDLRTIQRMEGARSVVARVSGPNTILRGQVYVSYGEGRWSAPQRAGRRIEFKAAQDGWIQFPGVAPQPSHQWTISPVKDVIGLVPSPTGAYRVYGMAEVALDSYDALIGDTIEPYTVVASDRCDERSPSCIPALSEEYLAVPEELVQPLKVWSDPIVGGAEPAQSLWSHLSEKGHYDPQARRSGDPVLSFVDGGLHGHCELFASTLALALRVRGVPTRYVVGFQLAEKNPWGGYYIVRDRDAHAWVEAYVGGRWQSFDPTPASQFAATHPDGTRPDLLEGLLDGFKSAWAALLSWLRRVSVPAWLLLLGTLSPLVWIALRRPQRWADMWRKAPTPDPQSQWLAQFESRLRRCDLLRGNHETVLEFAQRLQDELTPECAAVYGQWLKDYAAVRFGGGSHDLGESLKALPQAVRKR